MKYVWAIEQTCTLLVSNGKKLVLCGGKLDPVYNDLQRMREHGLYVDDGETLCKCLKCGKIQTAYASPHTDPQEVKRRKEFLRLYKRLCRRFNLAVMGGEEREVRVIDLEEHWLEGIEI